MNNVRARIGVNFTGGLVPYYGSWNTSRGNRLSQVRVSPPKLGGVAARKRNFKFLTRRRGGSPAETFRFGNHPVRAFGASTPPNLGGDTLTCESSKDWSMTMKLSPMRLLPGQPICPPKDVATALKTIFGERVDDVVVVENSWIAWLHGRVAATTRKNRIYLRGRASDFFRNPALMLHEYCHVLRQWQTGDLTTLRYLMESLRNGYWRNRYEVEARRFAEENLPRFR
jgi:hypothetical protein